MSGRSPRSDLFEAALAAEGVNGSLADVARSIYMQESGGGKNTRTSNAGAMGGMQIIPSTFASVADKGWDIKDPLHNARAGIRYLRQLDKQAGGDPVLTAAGYYGGPGGLEKARRGIAVIDPRNPNAPNTLQYGQQVASRLPVQVTPQAPAPVRPVVREVPEAVPLQAAEVASPVQVAQVNPEWQALQQAMPPQAVQASDLDYGPLMDQLQRQPQLAPLAYGPAPSLASARPDFRAFTPMRARV